MLNTSSANMNAVEPPAEPTPAMSQTPAPEPIPPYHRDDTNTLPPYEQQYDEFLYDTIHFTEFFESIDAFITDHPDAISLPITTAPSPRPLLGNPRHVATFRGAPAVIESPEEYEAALEISEMHIKIVSEFYSAVTRRRDDIARQFVSRGYVSPDVPSDIGETPLLAAVRANDGVMLCALAALGATVNGYGAAPTVDSLGIPREGGPQRTPLQHAAAEGRLPLVKVLLEDLGADDALVAPDGEIALRLAARGRHAEVVAYLPARRAGAGLRLRTAGRRATKRVWTILCRVGEALRLVLWECPKCLTYYPMRELWRSRHKIVGWVKKEFKAIPRRVKQAGKLVKETGKLVVEGIKKTPAAVGILLTWIWEGIRGVSVAVVEAVKRVVAALHTVWAAAVDFFKRITLKDVWNGVVAAVRAVFVGLPQAVWRFLRNFSQMSYDALAKLGGFLGKVVWYLLWFLLQTVIWLPKQAWKILVAIGRVIGKGVEEVLVFLNPKRVG
ncbi:hypothetical protein ACHAQA_006137 [Verticillium albo-atrum]